VARAREASLATWIHALGIPSVGKTIAMQLGASHDSLAEIACSSLLTAIVDLEQHRADAVALNPNSRKHPLQTTARRKAIEADLKGTRGETRAALMSDMDAARASEQEERASRQHQYDDALTAVDRMVACVREAGLTEEVGPVVARNVLDFFASETGTAILNRLEQLGINPKPDTAISGASAIAGQSFVLTGTLTTMTRDEAADIIRRQGGRVSGSVSSKTNFLVVGAEAGVRKLAQAEKAAVAILTEKDLLTKLGVPEHTTTPRQTKPSQPEQQELF